MRVAIVGAGAIGTLLGHGFCKSGHTVTLLDLPERVAQLRDAGALVIHRDTGNKSSAVPYLITCEYSEAGTQDFVFLATKSHDLPAVAEGIAELTHAETTIITLQNGIPWWYLQDLPHKFGDARLKCLDPEGVLDNYIDSSRILGCVAYPAAILNPDGSVSHVEGDRFPVGELAGGELPRTRRAVQLFESAGFKSRIIGDIRSEIWLKAWGALSINPISALTRATMEDICSFEATRELIMQMMSEAQHVAESFGAHFRHTIEKRIEGAQAVGAHKTSMLQDVENRRRLELDGLMLAVMELASIAGRDTPTIRNVYACAALLDNTLRTTLP